MKARRRKSLASNANNLHRSSYVACPACQMQVSSRLINVHLDMICPSLSSSCSSVGPPAVPHISDGTYTNVNPTSSNSRLIVPDANFLGESQSTVNCCATQGMLDFSHIEQSAEGTLLEGERFKVLFPCRQSAAPISPVNNGAQLSECSEVCSPRDTSKYKPGGCLGGGHMEKKREKIFMNHFSTMPASQAPKGHYIIEDFITAEEEDYLLHSLDIDLANPWKLLKFNGLYMGKAYGRLVDLRKRMIFPPLYEMPRFLTHIVQRMKGVVPTLNQFVPNETNAIDYRKEEGHYLKAHVDDRQLSGQVIVNLTLCGSCFMTYERERGFHESYRVKLNRRSLQILTGESRWNFTHSIKNEDLVDSRRVSMTFRESITN